MPLVGWLIICLVVLVSCVALILLGGWRHSSGRHFLLNRAQVSTPIGAYTPTSAEDTGRNAPPTRANDGPSLTDLTEPMRRVDYRRPEEFRAMDETDLIPRIDPIMARPYVTGPQFGWFSLPEEKPQRNPPKGAGEPRELPPNAPNHGLTRAELPVGESGNAASAA